jgi:hypothetical protein
LLTHCFFFNLDDVDQAIVVKIAASHFRSMLAVLDGNLV